MSFSRNGIIIGAIIIIIAAILLYMSGIISPQQSDQTASMFEQSTGVNAKDIDNADPSGQTVEFWVQ